MTKSQKVRKDFVFRKHVFFIKEGELPVPESFSSEPTHASVFSTCIGTGREGCGWKKTSSVEPRRQMLRCPSRDEEGKHSVAFSSKLPDLPRLSPSERWQDK